ncbi:MAG: hypothetical protein AAGB18_05250 [Pseudomonadota bacterium]
MRTSIFLFFLGLGICGAALMAIGTDGMSGLQILALVTVIAVLLAAIIGLMTVRDPLSIQAESNK